MMGHQSDSQDKLFYSFNLDDHVPQNHLLRGINQFLDLSDLRQHLTQFYSHTGRPSIDAELMIRMSNGVQYFPSNSVHICQWSFRIHELHGLVLCSHRYWNTQKVGTHCAV